jgi:hypothetical protein
MSAEIQLVKGRLLPRAINVGDTDDVFIIQAGVTKIARKTLIDSVGGGASVAVVVPVAVSGSGSIVVEAGTYIQEAIVIGVDGEYKVGTSVGGGEIIEDTYTGDYVSHPGLGRYFALTTTIHFTGDFFIKLLLWATE